MESVITFTCVDGYAGVPDDYLAWRRLTWLGSPYRDLEYVTPQVLTRQFPNVEAGIPLKFTIEGTFFHILPKDDGTDLEFNYYAKLQPLEVPEDSNWLLQEYPDVYLAGTLAWVNTLVQNTEQFQQWIAATDQIIERAMLLSEKTKGPAAIQISGQAW